VAKSGSSHRSESSELLVRSVMITVSTPGSAGLPRLRERMSFLDGADRETEKVSDVFHHRLEFSLLDVGLVLRAKGGPLPVFVYVVIELGREGDRQTRHRKVSPTFLKGVLNGLGECFPFEREHSRRDLEVVEILHAGIGDSEFHKCFEFFGSDRFFRIGQQTRAREFQERGMADLGRRWRDDVAKADVNLNGNLCAFETFVLAPPYLSYRSTCRSIRGVAAGRNDPSRRRGLE
jgi:hypothetical protein